MDYQIKTRKADAVPNNGWIVDSDGYVRRVNGFTTMKIVEEIQKKFYRAYYLAGVADEGGDTAEKYRSLGKIEAWNEMLAMLLENVPEDCSEDRIIREKIAGDIEEYEWRKKDLEFNGDLKEA